jgi:GAF domain-containing protein
MRDGSAIGVISLGGQLGGFTDSQIALLQTFAEQAAIAITSAGTFRALQNRTAELTRSVAELQALEEVLRAMNSSLDLDTVLATIISRAVQLSQADEGTIYEYDVSEQVFVPKSAFGMSAERVAALRERRIKLGETHLGRSAMQRAPVYVEDVQQDSSVPNAGDVLPGIHAVLAVPLLRNDAVVGGLVIRRRTEEGLRSTIVTLMHLRRAIGARHRECATLPGSGPCPRSSRGRADRPAPHPGPPGADGKNGLAWSAHRWHRPRDQEPAQFRQ